MKKLFTVICSLLIFSNTEAQDLLKIDSLITQLGKNNPDTLKCRIYVEIAEEYTRTDTLTALEFLGKVKELAEKSQSELEWALYHDALGKLRSYHGAYPSAIRQYSMALQYYMAAKDSSSYYSLLIDKGNAYLFMSRFDEALDHYNEALRYYRNKGNMHGISRCLNNMGIIYKNKGDYLRALEVYSESIRSIKEDNDPMNIAQAYINIGNVHVLQGNYSEAIQSYDRALMISRQENSEKEIALCLLNLGVVQNKMNNYREAENLYKHSLQVSESIHDKINSSNCLINIGTNYSEMGEIQLALEYVNRGMKIKQDLGDIKAISNCYIHLAEIYSLDRQYTQADSLFNLAGPIKEQLDDQDGLIRVFMGRAYIAYKQGFLNRADSWVDQAMKSAYRINAKEYVTRGFDLKRQIAEKRGDYLNAYHYAMQFKNHSDSLKDEATRSAVKEIEFKYRSQELENENENLRIRSEMNEAVIKKRNSFLYSVLALVVLLASGLLLVVYFQNRLRLSRNKLEEKNLVITRQNMKLDGLNKQKDQIMSIIAHDLRGTLGNQLITVELLQKIKEEKDEQVDQGTLLYNLKKSSTYSLELLENLLHWSRIENSEIYFNPEVVDIAELIRDILQMLQEHIRAKNVSVKVEAEEDTRGKVDRNMMETIVRNLLSNAVKFSSPGGVVSVAIRTDHSKLILEVKDEGMGITEEDIQRIYHSERFTRPGTMQEKGAGIGLQLVREFTVIHHGELFVSSQPGKGSIFKIIIPLLN